MPINIDYLDLSIFLFADYKGNHYKLINEAFYNNSSLNNLFKENKTIGNDINYSGLLNEKVMSVINVDSDQSSTEIFKQEFSHSILNTRCSIGQIKGFSFNSDMYEIYYEHSKLAFNYFNEVFIPNVIIPLDKLITKQND